MEQRRKVQRQKVRTYLPPSGLKILHLTTLTERKPRPRNKTPHVKKRRKTPSSPPKKKTPAPRPRTAKPPPKKPKVSTSLPSTTNPLLHPQPPTPPSTPPVSTTPSTPSPSPPPTRRKRSTDTPSEDSRPRTRRTRPDACRSWRRSTRG